jgi:hypothetical protein
MDVNRRAPTSSSNRVVCELQGLIITEYQKVVPGVQKTSRPYGDKSPSRNTVLNLFLQPRRRNETYIPFWRPRQMASIHNWPPAQHAAKRA